MNYTSVESLDFCHLILVAHLERDTIELIRVSFEDYHRINHPNNLVTPDGRVIPIEPSCCVPVGTVQSIDYTPAKPVAAKPGALKRLLSRMNPLRRPKDD